MKRIPPAVLHEGQPHASTSHTSTSHAIPLGGETREATPPRAVLPRGRWAARAQARALRLGSVLGLLLLLGLAGCSLDSLLNSDELPPDKTDPAITETPEGALAAYYGTLVQFRTAFGASGSGSVITTAGLLSDELRGALTLSTPEDQRALPESDLRFTNSATTYGLLQKVRGQAGLARGLLAHYRPAEPALAGRLAALEGYAELFLAELFCSGIPLSTLDYGGDYTYQPGSSTEAVLEQARARFSTALELGSATAAVTNLARVGLGRALLASGRYAEAAAAVAAVPDGYRDTLTYPAYLAADTARQNASNFAYVSGPWPYSVADREGTQGLDYVSSQDPRIPVAQLATFAAGFGPQWHPSQYATSGATPLVLASGVEARLIEAEAALQTDPNGSGWLATLNALRTDGSEPRPTEDPTDDPAATYTYWRPGSGGVDSLPLLADPGSDSARVSLMFRERAFWLFLTGHRQGDLRRLLRRPEYNRYWPLQDRLYPVGTYTTTSGFGDQYGSDVTAPIPPAERVLNPRFNGCLSRGP